MVLVDAETGGEAEPVVVDRVTGRRLDGPDYVFTAGPAALGGPTVLSGATGALQATTHTPTIQKR